MLHCHYCDNLVLEMGHVSGQGSLEVVSAHVVAETLLGIVEKLLGECRMRSGERTRVIVERILPSWLGQGGQVVKIFLMLRQILVLRLLVREIAFSNCHLCMDLFVAEFVILVCSLLLQYLLVVNRVFVEVIEVGHTCVQAKQVFLVLVATVWERSLVLASVVDYGLDYRMVILIFASVEILRDHLCVVRAFLRVHNYHLDLCSLDCATVYDKFQEATCFELLRWQVGRKNQCHLFDHLGGHLFCRLSKCLTGDRVRWVAGSLLLDQVCSSLPYQAIQCHLCHF